MRCSLLALSIDNAPVSGGRIVGMGGTIVLVLRRKFLRLYKSNTLDNSTFFSLNSRKIS